MDVRDERYVPGFGSHVSAMLERRRGPRCLGFLWPRLQRGMRVLDLGCGPGTLTVDLASAVGPDGCVVGIDTEHSQLELAQERALRAGADNVTLVAASAYELPFERRSFDAVVAHALFEHLARPAAVLAEIRRVLGRRGLLGAASSDWSGAVVEPRTRDVEGALRAHHALRRRGGGDPFAGRRLPELVASAGFRAVEERHELRPDMSYREVASYVASRIAAHRELDAAAEAARRWAESGDGRFEQRWVCVTATR